MEKAKNINDLRAFRYRQSFLLPEKKGISSAEIIRQLIAVNADNIEAAYLALLNRLNYFTRQSLEEILYHSKEVGRLRGMRNWIYLIPKEDFEFIYSATFKQREYPIKQSLKLWGIKDSEYTSVARPILKSLAIGELKKAQLIRKIPGDVKRKITSNSGGNEITSLNTDLILESLLGRWQVIRGVETWEKPGIRYCLFDTMHHQDSYSMNNDKAEQELVLRYVTNYGPVRLEDISWWTELTPSRVTKILSQKKDEINELVISGLTGLFYIGNKSYNNFMANSNSLSDSFAMLGANDPLLMGYRLSEPQINPEYRKSIFSRIGESAPVLLINGSVAGTWNYKLTKNCLQMNISLFKQTKIKLEDKLCAQVDRLGDFIGGEDKSIEVRITYME